MRFKRMAFFLGSVFFVVMSCGSISIANPLHGVNSDPSPPQSSSKSPPGYETYLEAQQLEGKKNISPFLKQNLYSRACFEGYRPACSPDDLISFEKNQDEKAGIFRGPGSPPTAEEKRLGNLCDTSHWAMCPAYGRLASARLLKNCELGRMDDCSAYNSAIQYRNTDAEKPIWRTVRALPAMRKLCGLRNDPSPTGYENFCKGKFIIEEELRYTSLPQSIAGTTRSQRQDCIQSGYGADGTTTQNIIRDSTGDVVRVDRNPNYNTWHRNVCRYAVTASCESGLNAIIITLQPNQVRWNCSSLSVK